jgi:predicted amidophosphoribosyltransferase
MKISKVEFGSLLTYSPHGNSTEHFKSRTVMRNLKNDEVLQSGILMSENIARAIKKELNNYPFADYFSQNTILIPTPKSSLLKKDMLWVPQRITSALVNNGLGKNEECLYRDIPLPRSSTSLASDRPKASQHYDSIKVRKLLFEPKEILLVDDVITRGATVLGAVNKLADAFPNARIRAFAVMRTISNPDEFLEIIQPCVGTITLSGEDTFRRP